MENASKAIIIAGGILIALVIISLLVVLFGQLGAIYVEEDEALSVKQMEEYNRKFTIYNNVKGLYGTEILSLANLMNEYNAKLLESVDGDESASFYTENKVNIELKLYNIVGEPLKDKITGKNITNKYGKEVKEYSKRYNI